MTYHMEQHIAYLRATLVGKRVELDYTNDPYTNLVTGQRGTVDHIDDMGTIFVRWENGSRLGLITEAGDRYRVVGG
jgi:hypothetical protein